MTLTHSQARDFYDKFGKRQDSQFYEAVAIKQLVEQASFGSADSIYEFGCGTGSFAAELLSHQTPDDCIYKGLDVSSTMVTLARQRMEQFGARAQIDNSDGKPLIREQSESFDRFISNYVLDLLHEDDIKTVLGEAHRILKPGGLVCLVSLTHGKSMFARLVEYIWTRLYRFKASLVGGCRPLRLDDFVGEPNWQVEFLQSVSSFGITSEILVAKKL